MKKNEIISFGVIGFFVTLLITLPLYLVFSDILVKTVLDNINSYGGITIIILGFLGITMVVSFITAFIINEDLKRKLIVYISIYSTTLSFLIILILSYVSSYKYVGIYMELESVLEMFFVFPVVIVYYSIYTLDVFFYLILQFIIIYYILFMIFLNLLGGENFGKKSLV